MEKVSNAYMRSMKSELRGQGYIQVTFGLINQDAQSNVSLESGGLTNYSNVRHLFTDNVSNSVVYGALEHNLVKADGSTLVLPRDRYVTNQLPTGLVSDKLVSDEHYMLRMNLNIKPTDIKGLSISFGQNYPSDFNILYGDNQKIEIRGNEQSEFKMEQVIRNTDYVNIEFLKMKHGSNRLRIYSITFGYGLVYGNDSILDSNMSSEVSPIGAKVPQTDFKVTIKNNDKYFNIDNPNSAVHFLETGQTLNVQYGYELPNGKIEWLQGNRLQCSKWSADDNKATIEAQDVFRNMSRMYERGIVSDIPITYYDLAERVLIDAGIDDYYIDARLRYLSTKNAIPKVKHKEALQMIANACRCTLTQNRLGQVQIKSNFYPDLSVKAKSQTTYSNVANILIDKPKTEYMSFAENYGSVEGNMKLLPKNKRGDGNTGFVSQSMSDENGVFNAPPELTFKMDGVRQYHSIKLTFGQSLPSKFKILAYKSEELIDEVVIEGDEIEEDMILTKGIGECDKLRIVFYSTQEPHNRIVLNRFELSDIVNFKMTNHDMLSSPTVVKNETVRAINVSSQNWIKDDTQQSVVGSDVTVTKGEVATFYTSQLTYDYIAQLSIDEDTIVEGGVEVIDSSSHYVTVRYLKSGTYHLNVTGKYYQLVEQVIGQHVNNYGKTIDWTNPLVDNVTMAKDLAKWLANYYSYNIEYKYNTRGNPELDVNDLIYQENDYVDNLTVAIERQSLRFANGFKGNVMVRRKEHVD